MGSYYEFFAGAGMVRAGLDNAWSCLFANDIDSNKAASYIENWGTSAFLQGDIAKLSTRKLPGTADLAWASFPCQDLSLAGSRAGLAGERSGTFWPFWRLMSGLSAERREPTMIVLENVCGALTSNGGRDFQALSSAIARLGYGFGALVIDAMKFLPQSRPRLFIIAVRSGQRIPTAIFRDSPAEAWSTRSLLKAVASLPAPLRKAWIWWHLPVPPRPSQALADLVEREPEGVAWHTEATTQRLLGMMNHKHAEKVQAAAASNRAVGTIYRRMRPDGVGGRIQRAEVRFDGNAGCLRSSRGGSSRQTVIMIDEHGTRSRLLSPREAARLMGLPETYQLPCRYNEAYDLAGEGVVVPVVRHLAAHILEPILAAGRIERHGADLLPEAPPQTVASGYDTANRSIGT